MYVSQVEVSYRNTFRSRDSLGMDRESIMKKPSCCQLSWYERFCVMYSYDCSNFKMARTRESGGFPIIPDIKFPIMLRSGRPLHDVRSFCTKPFVGMKAVANRCFIWKMRRRLILDNMVFLLSTFVFVFYHHSISISKNFYASSKEVASSFCDVVGRATLLTC